MSENRLAAETSPYLLQHKDNPVHWWAWGPEPFAEAQRTGKPVLLSVGYAACHWCHVMAHESFEDQTIAGLMNELFVNIKVDREERPDIDQIYMSALQQLGEHGGWPLTMFLDGAGAPFWGGTYFPPTPRFGRPGFPDVLRQISDAYRNDSEKIRANTEAIVSRLKKAAQPKDGVAIGLAELDNAGTHLVEACDAVQGGLKGAPKFPQCGLLELMWRTFERTGDTKVRDMVLLTLNRMSEGGIYDHVGGGYARYSTDEIWFAPHFEKMLYDNAQLLELLSIAYKATGEALFLRRARETIAWLEREMLTESGAFTASLDADSEGIEGKFYVWDQKEIDQILGAEDAAFFSRIYDVSPPGNWEHGNILNRTGAGAISEADEERLAPMRAKLLEVRATRVRPGRDDKVLADWNGLMIAALARAGAYLGEPSWIALAQKAFSAVCEHLAEGDRIGHSWCDGKAVHPGLASDHAAMARAGIALHEATGEGEPLDRAVAFLTVLERHHLDEATGAYFLTANDAEDLIVRPRTGHDEAAPNYNAVAADALTRLATLVGDEGLRARADRILTGLSGEAARNVIAHAGLLNAIDTRLRLAEIVVVGDKREAFAEAALKVPFLHRVVVRAAAAKDLPPGSLAAARVAAAPAEGAAFVCVGERCSLPVSDPDGIIAAMAEFSA